MIALPHKLTASEMAALRDLGELSGPELIGHVGRQARTALRRHLQPLEVEARRLQLNPGALSAIRRCVCRTMLELGSAYCHWHASTWATTARNAGTQFAAVHSVAHALGCLTGWDVVAAGVVPTTFARRLFGAEAVGREQKRIIDYLRSVGYRHRQSLIHSVPSMVSRLLICGGEGRLEAITTDLLAEMRGRQTSPSLRRALYKIAKALYGLGIIAETIRPQAGAAPDGTGIDPEWLALATRWRATSTLSKKTRTDVFGELRRAGRWLSQLHPDVHTPRDWSRQLAAEYVAAVHSWTVGAFASPDAKLAARGTALNPTTKDGVLAALRRFFKDCRDWEWSEPRFDPQRAFATPRSVRALMSRDPRVIADEIWAKLIWAGLNLQEADQPTTRGGRFGDHHLPVYPAAMTKALAITWLFAGLRVDELVRLRVGCIRWQNRTGGPGAATTPEPNATCLLDVPVHKTGASYTKPVDPVVGKHIAAWEAVRPNHPHVADPKTGELVPMLFCWRGRHIPGGYINRSLIPTLCRKAGVPLTDARGRITGHRARHTIASQLYNAKEPMSLFELQSWLGHRSPASTQYYVRINPTKLTKAYTDAGYFARNIRAIKVLIDREAITSGAAAEGQTWQYFDLGHGYCTYNFFEQCRHRMACARCDFYLPKDSTRVQLLEAKANLQRMLIEIPLTEDERAAVEDGQAAVDRLLGRLADVATPAGPTPRQLGRQLPILPPEGA